MVTSLLLKWSKRGWTPNGLVFKCHLNTTKMDIIFFCVLVQLSNVRSSTKDKARRVEIKFGSDLHDVIYERALLLLQIYTHVTE